MEIYSLLQKKLLDNNFVYTAETTPPDSATDKILLENVMPLRGIADAINITDSPGAKVHMSSLTAAIILSQNQMDPILQLTIRDRNRLAIQGDLVGASALGVHNILCLKGDDMKTGDQPEAKPVNDLDSLGLASMVNVMRKEKKFLSGRIIDPPPKFYIGGAEAPTIGEPNPEKILNKINKGIDFFQTQYVFDVQVLKKYMKIMDEAGVLEKTNFIIGIGPFASAKSAKWMNENLAGVNVPDEIIKRLESSKDAKEESKKICIELINDFKKIKGVKGVHLMGHKKEKIIAEIIKESQKQ